MLFKVRAQMEAVAADSLKRSSSCRTSGGAGADKTVQMQYKQSLDALMMNINKTTIRCTQPNSVEMEDNMVANKLRCAGVIEAFCIARAGYPNRLLHAEFAEQFDIFLMKKEQYQRTGSASVAFVKSKKERLETTGPCNSSESALRSAAIVSYWHWTMISADSMEVLKVPSPLSDRRAGAGGDCPSPVR
jgi:myosin heavy subunit